MKVLLVAHGFPPSEAAGTELLALNTAKGLIRTGNDVVVFAPAFSPEREGSSLVDGIRVRRLFANPPQQSGFSDTYLNDAIDTEFAKFVFEEKPHVAFLLHTMNLSAGVLEVLSELGVPYGLFLTDFHYLCHQTHLLTADLEPCDGPGDGSRCRDCILATVRSELLQRERKDAPQLGRDRTSRMRELLKLPTAIVAPSDFVKEKYVEYGVDASKILVIPPGVDLEKIKARYNQVSSDKLRFGYLGGNSEIRGISVLLDAFQSIRNDNVELVLGGPGLGQPPPGRPKLANVRYVGPYLQEHVGSVLSAIDVLVVPSRCHESYNLVAREAIAAGIPVIVSDLRAQSDAVRNGVDGLHFTAGDSSDLASKMLLLRTDSKILKALKRRLPNVPNINDYTAKLEELLKRLVRAQKLSPNEMEARFRIFLQNQIDYLQSKLREREMELPQILERERQEFEKRIIVSASDPLTGLLLLYKSRLDLQAAFPEVSRGDYLRLLDWAKESLASGTDESHAVLARHLEWYRRNPWGSLSQEKTRLESQLAVRDEKITNLAEEKTRLESEVSDIKGSFGYRWMRFYASRIDRLFPDGTSRGEFRKDVITSLRVITMEGFKSYFHKACKKIRRREL